MSILQETMHDLRNALQGNLTGTQIESAQEAIGNYAIAAAVAGAVSGLIPGVAGILAALAQTGLIWATYVKINQTLGISMKENTAKFIGSAIATNLVAGVGSMIVSYAAAAIISFIPIFGQILSAAINAGIGYVFLYVSAIVYLKLITQLVKPDGTIDVEETDETKDIIKDLMKDLNLENIITEGRDKFKKDRSDGKITDAIKNRRCPNCQKPVEASQKFCPHCGSPLK